jgi:predicted ferric reductase
MKKTILYSLLVANVLATIWIWWIGSGLLFAVNNGGTLIALGRLAGLLLQLTILLQVILMGRISFIEQTFGHDKLNKLHRLVGYSVLVLFFIHPLLLSLGYAQLNATSILAQFLDFLKNYEDVLRAFVGWGIFIFVIGITITLRKKIRYETWYFIHLLVYIAIAFTFGHQTQSADVSVGKPLYYWLTLNFIGFGVMLLYRFGKPIYQSFKYQFKVERISQEAPDIYSIYITGKDISKFKFRAGQFANLNFIGFGLWFTHPFSFSQAPGHDQLRFSIKTLGDFTNKVNSIKLGTRVILDGPLGLFTASQAMQKKFLFIAGGIGITPIRALLEEQLKNNRDMVLLYANKTLASTAFKTEIEQLGIKTTYVLSNDESQQTSNIEHGYINSEKIKRLVPDYLEREIYLCGPPVMMTALITELEKLGIQKKYIHFEKFSY